MATFKKCKKCNLEKDKEEFSKMRTSKDGLFPNCKECTSRYMAKYYENNKEKQKLSGIDFRKSNPSYRSDYYLKNKETNIDKNIEWRRNNKDKANAMTRKRRATKLDQLGFMPKDHEQRMLDVYGSKYCMRCSSDKNIHIDHIIPVSKGGLWCLSNFQFLCEGCNISKGNKHSTDYRNEGQKYDMLVYMSWMEKCIR